MLGKKSISFSHQTNSKIIRYGTVSGVKYLHDHHVVHGNISLKSVFLDLNGVIKVGDYGLT